MEELDSIWWCDLKIKQKTVLNFFKYYLVIIL